MSDDASTAKLAALRTQKSSLQAEVRKFESQVALLEKKVMVEGREPGNQGASQKLEEAEAKLEAVSEELQRVTEELEGAEEALQVHAETTDELERLIDSFAPVAAQVPELAEILAAMRLCIGALATARRLERRDESLTEAKDISKALSEALLRLASTMSTRAQVLQTTGRK